MGITSKSTAKAILPLANSCHVDRQLRPKVNNYFLTVEKGNGFDLNRSMFERLVLKGYPHTTLSQQHRMRPEISDLVRQLTYPALRDADGTKNRKHTRGLQDDVIFLSHDRPEDENPEMKDNRELYPSSSKRNTYEAEMVLKIVRYLAQQGYGTEKLVVLTPYLGQLQLLQSILKTETDPVLNDLDSFDLVRAGLVTEATAKLTQRPLRLATIGQFLLKRLLFPVDRLPSHQTTIKAKRATSSSVA